MCSDFPHFMLWQQKRAGTHYFHYPQDNPGKHHPNATLFPPLRPKPSGQAAFSLSPNDQKSTQRGKALSPPHNPPINSLSHAIHLPHRPIPNKTTRRPRRKRLARLPRTPQLPEEMVTTRSSSQHLLHLPIPLQRLRHLHTPRKRKLLLELPVPQPVLPGFLSLNSKQPLHQGAMLPAV